MQHLAFFGSGKMQAYSFIKWILPTYNKNKLCMKMGTPCEVIIVYDRLYRAAGNLRNH